MEPEIKVLSEDEEKFFIGKDEQEGLKSKYDFEGVYNCEVTSAVNGKSASGNKKTIIKLVGQEGPALGLLLTDHAPPFKLGEAAKSAGIKPDADGNLIFGVDDIVGKIVRAKFKREEFNGKWSAKVDRYLPVPVAAGGVSAL